MQMCQQHLIHSTYYTVYSLYSSVNSHSKLLDSLSIIYLYYYPNLTDEKNNCWSQVVSGKVRIWTLQCTCALSSKPQSILYITKASDWKIQSLKFKT